MKGEISRTGVMIHYVSFVSPLVAQSKVVVQVIEEVDRGEPLVVEEVLFEHPRDDRLEDFEARMHGVEHSLIVKGVGVAIERLLSRG
jgi:phosphoribosylglycinamide formyltransferase